MVSKLTTIIFVLVISSLITLELVLASSNVKVFEFPGNSEIKNSASFFKGERFRRVIADDFDEQDIASLKTLGCRIKHRMRRTASFDCPEDVNPEGVRESRVFHIVDLQSDQQIQADDVWAEGITGSGVKVVVLDTGIDSSHIELSDSILGQWDFVNNDNIAEDEHGHGTHVAGIITANGVNMVNGNYATGVAPSADIYMLKVCDGSGNCYEDDMIAAMEYAVNNLDAKIMSISIGGGNFGSHCDYDPLAAKVNWVVDNGITVAVAAGNDGKGVSSPACASKAIAVAASYKSGVVPYWSNRGTVDITAPGVDILSTYSCLAAGDCALSWYAWMSGTSMAAPHVSGVAALLLETDPTLTDNEIKNAMYSTADPAAACYECTRWSWWGTCRRQGQVTCTSDIVGAGIVDAYEAYLAVKPTVCVPSPEICDGIDNDCDDLVDEDLTRQCGLSDTGICAFGTETCSAGNWVGCDAVYPANETCNLLDDDCDGLTDEDLTENSGTDIGECQVGVMECVIGFMTVTVPEIGPTPEVCDNKDNDCDGTTDQNTQQCGATDVGACEYGTQTCSAGTWESCIGEIGPTTETCNGLDNDCDGTTDNGFPNLGDACSVGVGACEASGSYACTLDGLGTECSAVSGTPTNEICDGIDNDCDGVTDEGGVCEVCVDGDGDGYGNPASSICTYPELDCDDSNAEINPAATEVCDSLDNNCDEQVDEGGVCDVVITQCWSADYQYLYRNRNQLKKFCKCAEGNYGYNSYSYTWGRRTVYRYTDSGNNENWEVTSRYSYLPVYRVMCTDGVWYNANQDYFFN